MMSNFYGSGAIMTLVYIVYENSLTKCRKRLVVTKIHVPIPLKHLNAIHKQVFRFHTVDKTQHKIEFSQACQK